VSVIDHRRHSMRPAGGEHLSQAGVDRARRVGETLPSYDVVITSPVARAFETAIAMGFAVHEQWPALAPPADEVHREADWEKGCAEYARAADLGGAVARYLSELAGLFQALANRLPRDGQALVISHGGVLEAATVACLPDKDYTGWDTTCSYCEGIRLHVANGRFTDAELLTVPF
jgi:broad specificity phosphatase PhoE